MRLAIFWVDFLHYHVARINAAIQLAEHSGNQVIPIAIRPGSPEFPVPGYQASVHGLFRMLTDTPTSGDLQSKDSARKMVAVLQKLQPDAVAIAGYENRVSLAALGWCRRNRRGAILMSDSQFTDYPRTRLKEWLKHCLVSAFDVGFVAGKPHLAYLHQLGMRQENIYRSYDVVDNDFWSGYASQVHLNPRDWRRRLGLPEQYFLTACRLIPKKNVSGLIRSYDRYLHHTKTPWPLIIVGDGPLRGELVDLVHQMGLQRQVLFKGYLSADEMGPIYGLASVFILASSYSEQWGLVVNEAMAAKLPVLVSKICGCVPDLVINGKTGFSFDPDDEVALSDLLEVCSSGKVNLAAMGETAQTHIQGYSPQSFAENLFAAAETAIAHARTRRINSWPFPLVLP